MKERTPVLPDRFVPRALRRDLKFVDGCIGEWFSCGGMMVYRNALWMNEPATVKYPNDVPSRTIKDARSMQQRLLENEINILRQEFLPALLTNLEWVL